MSGYYDTGSDEVHVTAGASDYCRLHEIAHQDQWKHSRLWRFLIRLTTVPRVKYLALIAVEYDALRRARRVMRKLGIWTPEASNEAGRMFSSYVKKEPL